MTGSDALMRKVAELSSNSDASIYFVMRFRILYKTTVSRFLETMQCRQMNGSQGALRACTPSGQNCTEISAIKSHSISGVTRSGDTVNRRQQLLTGCARFFQCQSVVRSHEARLLAHTRVQAPLESSPYGAGAPVFCGDLELALIDKPGVPGLRSDSGNSQHEDHAPSGIGKISGAQMAREWT